MHHHKCHTLQTYQHRPTLYLYQDIALRGFTPLQYIRFFPKEKTQKNIASFFKGHVMIPLIPYLSQYSFMFGEKLCVTSAPRSSRHYTLCCFTKYLSGGLLEGSPGQLGRLHQYFRYCFIRPEALKPTSPQTLKPLIPQALKLLSTQTHKPSNS